MRVGRGGKVECSNYMVACPGFRKPSIDKIDRIPNPAWPQAEIGFSAAPRGACPSHRSSKRDVYL
ncbi:hypothetical protein SAMN04488568_102187 [Maricaulis salignorans]|uniref:Uncharacterized protein n=1 Tax=Maricaulis salignorans TaxID=144026 RepID=A0A1G9N1N8_9PROT|nr:hypothetical protein SAMN04488568_102187 [Maricaulis salignorans]